MAPARACRVNIDVFALGEKYRRISRVILAGVAGANDSRSHVVSIDAMMSRDSIREIGDCAADYLVSNANGADAETSSRKFCDPWTEAARRGGRRGKSISLLIERHELIPGAPQQRGDVRKASHRCLSASAKAEDQKQSANNRSHDPSDLGFSAFRIPAERLPSPSFVPRAMLPRSRVTRTFFIGSLPIGGLPRLRLATELRIYRNRKKKQEKSCMDNSITGNRRDAYQVGLD